MPRKSFLSTPSARRATRQGQQQRAGDGFLSTPSARRATCGADPCAPPTFHFYPRPPRGGRPKVLRRVSMSFHFYPRPPRGGRLPDRQLRQLSSRISIHALREEGDPGHEIQRRAVQGISIHALREEGDIYRPCFRVECYSFLSTPSARRATAHPGGRVDSSERFLSTPSARRATPTLQTASSLWMAFLSTPSARRATGTFSRETCAPLYFYPRPPRGGRPPIPKLFTCLIYFYPRPPRGGRLH